MGNLKAPMLGGLADMFPNGNDFYDKKEADIKEIEISKLYPYPDHPFRLYDGERLEKMIDSIKEFGVMSPIIVKPRDDESYTILSGHNRVNAAKMADLKTIPSIIKENLTSAEATLIVTETNFMQRSVSDMLPSELAKALQMHLNAAKEENKKIRDFEALENVEKACDNEDLEMDYRIGNLNRSIDKVAVNFNLSPTNIYRIKRIIELITPLQNRIDKNEFPLNSAVDLSYVDKEKQAIIETVLLNSKYKLDLRKSAVLKKETKNLDEELVKSILGGEYPKTKKRGGKPANFSLKGNILSKYFEPNIPKAQIEEVIEKALALYFKNHKEEETG